jgi:hypothetical protein
MIFWNCLIDVANHIFYFVGVGICLALFVLAIPNIITVLIEAYFKMWDAILRALDIHKAFLEFYKDRMYKGKIIKGEWNEDE